MSNGHTKKDFFLVGHLISKYKMMESNFSDVFKDHIINNYMSYTSRRLKYSEYFKLVDFLVSYQIIPKKIVRIYAVLYEFNYLFAEGRYKNKTQLIKEISKKFSLHENTVWNIVDKHMKDFEQSDNQDA